VLGTEQCRPKYGNCLGSQVIGTTNGGQATMSQWGIQAQLTASPVGNLAAAAWSIGPFMDISDTKAARPGIR